MTAGQESAAQLNNLGVAHLEIGQVHESMLKFIDALKQTTGEVNNDFDTPAMQPSTDESQAIHKVNVNKELGETVLKANCPDFFYKAISNRTSAPFIYTRAIDMVETPLLAYAPTNVTNSMICSAIIIMNLSLVYHLKGVETSYKSYQRLAKAQSLYKNSLSLLVNAGVLEDGSQGNPVVDLLALVLLNNLGQASHELQDYEYSRRIFDRLTCYALSIKPNYYCDAKIASTMDQQKLNFLLNAIILHSPPLAAAA